MAVTFDPWKPLETTGSSRGSKLTPFVPTVAKLSLFEIYPTRQKLAARMIAMHVR